jgi:Ca2+-binding EF-hand superfamily protein
VSENWTESVFKNIDKKNESYLTFYELYESLKKVNEIDREKLKELFDSVDINKSFKIDLVQFQRMLLTIYDRPDDFILNGYNKYLPLRLILYCI